MIEKTAGCLIVCLFLAGAAVSAAESPPPLYPTAVFDATYELQGPGGKQPVRFVSDGKGIIRTETKKSDSTTVTIADYRKKQKATMLAGKPAAIIEDFNPSEPVLISDVWVKHMKGKSLSTKVVNGHPCHGYNVSTPSGNSTVWIGDDTHYVVQQVTMSPMGASGMDLKSWATAPDPSLFALPSNAIAVPMRKAKKGEHPLGPQLGAKADNQKGSGK